MTPMLLSLFWGLWEKHPLRLILMMLAFMWGLWEKPSAADAHDAGLV